MKLRRNEYCPIHRSLFCCGREQAKKRRQPRLGVQRVEDLHHPRGYRELRSPAEMRKLLNRKVSSRAENAGSAVNLLLIAVKLFPTTSSQEEWELHDGTIIPTTFKRYIEGAMEKKGQEEPHDRKQRSALCRRRRPKGGYQRGAANAGAHQTS